MVANLNQEIMPQREVIDCAIARQTHITSILLSVQRYVPSSEEAVYLEWLQHVDLRAALIGVRAEAPIGKEHAESRHHPEAAPLVERRLSLVTHVRARCRRAVREL